MRRPESVLSSRRHLLPESPDPYTGNARNGPGFLEEVVIKRGEDSRGKKAGPRTPREALGAARQPGGKRRGGIRQTESLLPQLTARTHSEKYAAVGRRRLPFPVSPRTVRRGGRYDLRLTSLLRNRPCRIRGGRFALETRLFAFVRASRRGRGKEKKRERGGKHSRTSGMRSSPPTPRRVRFPRACRRTDRKLTCLLALARRRRAHGDSNIPLI